MNKKLIVGFSVVLMLSMVATVFGQVSAYYTFSAHGNWAWVTPGVSYQEQLSREGSKIICQRDIINFDFEDWELDVMLDTQGLFGYYPTHVFGYFYFGGYDGENWRNIGLQIYCVRVAHWQYTYYVFAYDHENLWYIGDTEVIFAEQTCHIEIHELSDRTQFTVEISGSEWSWDWWVTIDDIRYIRQDVRTFYPLTQGGVGHVEVSNDRLTLS